MKKTISLFLAVVFAAGALLAAPIQLPGLVVSAAAEETTVPNEGETGSSNADEGETGEATPAPETFLTFGYSAFGGYKVSGYTGEAVDELIIPSEYDGQPVVEIGERAFEGNLKIKKITFPETLEGIGRNAFASSSIQEAHLPDSVYSIDYDAFNSCQNLKSVTIPKDVRIIFDRTFYNCTELSEVIFSEGLLEISYNAFYGCTKLETIDIPDSVTYMFPGQFETTGAYKNADNWVNDGFYLGNHLISTTIPCPAAFTVKPGTVNIATLAFKEFDELVAIKLPKSIKRIGYNAIFKCPNLSFVFYEGTLNEFKKIYLDNNEVTLRNVPLIPEANGVGVPKTPTVKSVVNVAGGVQISWNEVDNADVYLVWRRGANTSDWTLLGVTDKTTVIDTTPGHRQYWRYSVQAMNADGFSDFDYTGKYLKYVATPKLTGISNATNGIYFKWNKVAGASGYRVYRRGAGGNWQYITTVKGTSYTDKAVKNQSGKYYRYTVRAVVDGRYSGYEDFLYTKRLANPKLTSATSGNGGITVKWNAISGTTGYYVYRKTANSGWKHVGTCYGTKTTSFLDKTASKGTTYTYTVRAVYGKTLSYFDSGIKGKR